MATTKLGGGGVQGVGLRNVGSTGIIPNTEASDIANSINSIVGNVGKALRVNQVQRDKEDMVRLVSKAETELDDSQKALQGASYDTELNNQVETWRGQGITDTEIYNNIAEYKLTKSADDFGLTSGSEPDEAINAFYDSYTKGMLKVTLPYAEQDRKALQKRIANNGSAYIRTGTDSVQDKLNNTTTLYKAYGLNESQAMGIIIQTAFSKARNGDKTMLEQLDTVKDSDGNFIKDTIEGSQLYSEQLKLTQQQEDYDARKAIAVKKAGQEVATTNLYAKMFEDGANPVAIQEEANNALRNGSITMIQHKQLTEQADDVMDVDVNPEVSDGYTYLGLRGKAELGLLTTGELMQNQSRLSTKDFTAIGNLAIKNGGINGTGTQKGKVIRTWAKNVSDTHSGYTDLISSKVGSLVDAQLVGKRKTYLDRELIQEVFKFKEDEGREPNNAEMDKISDRVVNTMKTLYPNPLGDGDIEIKITGVTKEDIDSELQGKTKEQQQALFSKMSDAQLRAYMGE